jgi:hypothetical protein
MSTKVNWNIYVTAYDAVTPNRGQQRSVQLHDKARLCTALSIKEFWSVYITILLHAPYSPDLSLTIFSYSHNRNENWKGINIMTHTPFRQPWQNSSRAFQQVHARTTSKTSTNAGSGIQMKEEAFQRKSLAPECKWHTDEGGSFWKEILSTRV